MLLLSDSESSSSWTNLDNPFKASACGSSSLASLKFIINPTTYLDEVISEERNRLMDKASKRNSGSFSIKSTSIETADMVSSRLSASTNPLLTLYGFVTSYPWGNHVLSPMEMCLHTDTPKKLLASPKLPSLPKKESSTPSMKIFTTAFYRATRSNSKSESSAPQRSWRSPGDIGH